MSLKLPTGQKRLTNIAIVRIKSHGKRFEIACYKNKVLNWREGIEKDLSEVIQTDTVFSNVGKGVVAKEKDLQTAFGTSDLEAVCRQLLKSGELQVSDKEREVHLEGLFRDITQIVVDRCVHPVTGRQLTALSVENALRTIGFSVQPDHTAKKQSLKAIEALCTELPESFSRAKMRLRITFPEARLEEVRRHLVETAGAQIEEEVSAVRSSGNGEAATALCALTFMCDPSHYRALDRLATVTYATEGVSLQIMTAAVLGQGASVGAAAVSAAPAHESTAAPAPPVPGAGPAIPAKGVVEQPAPGNKKREEAEAPKKGKVMKCSACSMEFEDAGEYRLHCRSELHTFNLKRKVRGQAPVSEEEFAEISLDVREGFLAVQ